MAGEDQQGDKMHINPGYIVGILPIYPHGTNSTMFTECCEVAICDDQPCCPVCGRRVIGYDADTEYWRGIRRSNDASRPWKK